MKIVLAPDKFKDALSGLQFCNAVEAGIKKVRPTTKIIKLPLADGGDGTTEVIRYHLKGETISVKVNNPFFKPVTASYVYAPHTKTAFIEMAEASGMKLLKPKQLDCVNATTFGTGELILDAIEKGAVKIILGIGGSATNDCGIGMAAALGYRFLDENNNAVKPVGANLSTIKVINFDAVHPKLKTIEFQIACDVTNPLYGNEGAAYVYAKQKGASAEDILRLDNGLKAFSKVIEAQFNIDPQNVQGAGAAGGMGIACQVFLNGALMSGIQLVKAMVGFNLNIEDADWIITGEGQLDAQTFSGKTIQGVLLSAKAHQIKVAALCGAIVISDREISTLGIDYCDAIMRHAKDLDDAMQNSYNYLIEMAKVFAEQTLKIN